MRLEMRNGLEVLKSYHSDDVHQSKKDNRFYMIREFTYTSEDSKLQTILHFLEKSDEGKWVKTGESEQRLAGETLYDQRVDSGVDYIMFEEAYVTERL